MLKSVFTIVVFAAVTTAVFAQNLVLSGDVKNYKITSYDKKYFIKLQNNNDIGRVEYNETLKKYVSFAFLRNILLGCIKGGCHGLGTYGFEKAIRT